MEVQLGAGALIDIATGDDMRKSTQSILDALSGEAQPLRFTQLGQRVGQVADPIDLGSPPIGRMWFILSITLIGPDPFATVASGLATLCIGDMASYHPGHVRVPALSIPQYRTTSSDGLWVHANESVYVLTSAIPALTQMSVNIQVEEWNTADISMRNPGRTPLT